MEERLDDLKLGTSAFQILCYLSFKDALMKPGEIAREIGQNPSTVRASLAKAFRPVVGFFVLESYCVFRHNPPGSE